MLLALLLCIALPKTSSAQRVSVVLENVSLAEALKKVSAASGYEFFYNSNVVLKSDKRITASFDGTELKTVLDHVFSGTEFSYRIKDRTIVVVPRPAQPAPEEPAFVEIAGRITDGSNKAPLAGVTVFGMQFLDFFDFLTNTGVIMLICLVATVVYFYFCFRRILRESESQRPADITYPDAASAITDRRAFIACGAVFLLVVVLLVTHAQTELTVATIGCIAAVLMALATLCTSGGHAAAGLFAKVDYRTLLFFIGLFVVVSGLEDTGCLDVLAGWISRISGGHTAVMVAIILWLSAVCSAFVDNIPFAATMVPVIQSMSQSQGVDLSVLAWALSIGTDLGGSATPIGASANVVGTSVAAKNGHPVTWGTYCKYCAPATVLVITIAMVYLFVRYL